MQLKKSQIQQLRERVSEGESLAEILENEHPNAEFFSVNTILFNKQTAYIAAFFTRSEARDRVAQFSDIGSSGGYILSGSFRDLAGFICEDTKTGKMINPDSIYDNLCSYLLSLDNAS